MHLTEQDVIDLEEAYAAFTGLVAELQPDDLALPTVNDGWTVRDVINHVVEGDHWAERYLRTGADEFSGEDYLGSASPVDAIAEGHRQVVAALRDVARDDADLPVPSLEIPSAEVVAIRIDELIGHGWDVAQATGQDTDIAPRLAARCLARVQASLRDEGARGEFFKPAQPVAADAPVADQYAAFCGKPVRRQ